MSQRKTEPVTDPLGVGGVIIHTRVFFSLENTRIGADGSGSESTGSETFRARMALT